jgi:hypothetical protein
MLPAVIASYDIFVRHASAFLFHPCVTYENHVTCHGMHSLLQGQNAGQILIYLEWL